ncbi:MAG: cell wall hydrolase [Sphaerospermopsis sp. SIO1G2]|nr:cell wall hydrolase [Sphaerospermopsis sp. SIO1G1]NET70247.1 cell wall hydrolase [Sphaerospermopsis sp. SIO1G2]
MKFGIDMGHNAPPDTGARGIKYEDTLTKDVGNRVISKLRSLGHTAISCTPTSRMRSVRQSLATRCNIANRNRVDVFVSIHFNAFNGRANGSEIFAMSSGGRKAAKPVLDEIIKLGFFNRGVKNGSHLYVIRNTNMPGILVECCFIDSAKDMQIYDSEKMANAIVKGLTGKVVSAPVNTVPDEEDNTDTSVLRIQKALNRLKITDKNNRVLDEDNIIGPATTSAIEKFQRIVGLVPTGRVNSSRTWAAINQILSKRLVQGNQTTGAIMKYIQYRVGTVADGIYGPNTEAAIKKFQQQNGLVADAIIGPMTWQKLIG